LNTRWGIWQTVAVWGVAATGATIITVAGAGTANADVCGSVGGRRVSVGGCADIYDAIADYAPPPSYYAPMPDDAPPPEEAPPPPPPPPPPVNVNVCVNAGRRINVSGCVG
jgi:hypothetical protein